MKIDYMNIEVPRFNEKPFKYVEVIFDGGCIAFYCDESEYNKLYKGMEFFMGQFTIIGYTYDTFKQFTYSFQKEADFIMSDNCYYRKIEDEKNGIRFEEMK